MSSPDLIGGSTNTELDCPIKSGNDIRLQVGQLDKNNSSYNNFFMDLQFKIGFKHRSLRG